MTTQIVLLRGINVGGANRVAMADLRAAIEATGATNVRTYVQSGNIVADGELGAITAAIKGVIDVLCVSRTGAELEAIIAANPFPEQAAESPKALQVTFRSEPVDDATIEALRQRATAAERIAGHGREIYSWHPEGMARSKLALAVVPAKAAATARNWNTVLKLAEMARV